MRLDPVTLEVVRNALPAICNEMSLDLQRTSYNMMIYEVRDYCCALLSPQGELWSQNVGGVSHFVADLGVVIRDGVARYGSNGFQPGDVIIHNHPATAGQHLNNVVIYTPYFHAGKLEAFAAVRAHWIDVGGVSTGFGAGRVADPWQEGLQLDQLKIYEAGVPNAVLLKVIRDNIRFPESSLGDMRSQIAACHLAQRRLEELFQKYGSETLHVAIQRIFADSEHKARAVVAAIPDGVYEAESFFDHDGVTDDPVPIRVRVEVSGTDMTIDFSGCSGERRGAINSRTYAGAMVAYKAITAPLEAVNEGSFRALRVILPEGNIMMARYPAPMAAWSAILPTVVDTVLLALAPALPHAIPAGHLGVLGGSIVFFGTDPKSGRPFVVQSIEGGGWGGRPHEDGPSASVSVCQGDVRNAPIEAIEIKCPVVVLQRAFRPDSGGAGRWRGGLGLEVRVQNLVEGRWNLNQTGRRKLPPWGLFGGQPGLPSDNRLRLCGQSESQSVDVVRHWVPAHSEAIICTAGGGGWGDPLDREPERVWADVRDGLVTVEAARRDYGVVLRPEGGIDAEATQALRAQLRQVSRRSG
ncbi:MAG: hydantoinase B/oxoprolinase family protein [Firmicutes bacterium]|nr:hydantoinase B/oxoprolinase family protein [Alicyclobacillaceae bacterium]MCL6498352.1 hydantoinase B/oxoprolinase family protein [Bacillota bacterium]